MSVTDAPVRDSALAVAAGDLSQSSELYATLVRLAGYLHTFEPRFRNEAVETVLLRWQGSLERNLQRVRDHAATDASDHVKSSSRRGASLQTIRDHLERDLSDVEADNFDPFEDDHQTETYFRSALRRAAISAARPPAPPPPPPPEPPGPDPVAIPEEVFTEAATLLEQTLLPEFENSNPKDWACLAELASGRSADEVAKIHAGVGATEQALHKRTGLVYQHWTRARQRLIKKIEERRGNKHFRTRIVPALRILIDERFRRNRRSTPSASSTRAAARGSR